METTFDEIEKLAEAMPPISLAEMGEVKLMNRTDCKYVTDIVTLRVLLQRTRTSYYTQEVAGQRVSPYATTYWDDEKLHMYRQHQTGHVPRRKVRVRTYLASHLSFLEVKNKDNHGRTHKERVKVPSLEAVENEHTGQDFLLAQTGLTFSDLQPTVCNHFNRLTLVNREKTERLTIDFGIEFYNYATGEHRTMPDVVVIELKRDGRKPSPILPILRDLRIKPAGFSKYCIGASVTTPSLHLGRFKKRLIKIRKVAEHALAQSAAVSACALQM